MIERTFLLGEIKEYLETRVDLFIFGVGEDDRDKFLRNLFTAACPKKSLVLCYDVERETFSIGGAATEYDLKRDLHSILKDYIKEPNYNLFLDITTLPVPFIFYMLLSLQEFKPIRVFCGYTTPLTYKKNDDFDAFDLTEKFIGIKTIPGYLRSDKLNRNRLLVMLLGYEGDRSRHIYEEVSTGDHFIPIIGLPGYQPGWHDTSYEVNLELIRETNSKDYTIYLAAESPFEVIDTLRSLQLRNKDKYLVISPLSTKALTLGVALYSLQDTENCSIIFDNPIDSKTRTTGVGKSYIYDVTELF